MAGPVNGNSVHAYDYAAVGQSYNYNPYAAQNGYRLDQHDSDILVVDSQPNGQEREELLFSSQPFSQGRPGHGHGQGQGQGAPQQQHHYGQGSMLEASQDEQIGTQLEASQESYNPTQPVATPSNAPPSPVDPTWGELVPHCKNPRCPQIKLSLGAYEIYAIGRASRWVQNGARYEMDTVIANPKISNVHCKIWREYDPNDPEPEFTATVMLEDCSSNGTYLNGERLGKGVIRFLEGGDEISLGNPHGDVLPIEDQYRFLFHPKLRKNPINKADPDALGGFYRKYELSHEIGKGSFATVWKALEKSTGKWRAVKIINKLKFAGNEKTALMLKREVDIMAEVDHPYVVKYFESFEDHKTLALVMELVTGGDLLDFITSKGGLIEDEAAEIAFMICDALWYLHDKKNIAHRDLKPENLLLTRAEHPVCKITDFGLAKLVDDQTFLQTMCGTPAYLAPEVVLQGPSKLGYNYLVDAYSLGVVIYGALSNASPFNEDQDMPIQQRIQTRQPDIGLLHSLGCSAQAIDFVSRLLVSNPAERMTIYDALNHPWIRGWRSKLAYTTGQTSFLQPIHPSPPVANPANSNSSKRSSSKHASRLDVMAHSSQSSAHGGRRRVPTEGQDQEQDQQQGVERLQQSARSSIRTAPNDDSMADASIEHPSVDQMSRVQQGDFEASDGNVSDVPSYSQRLGNLRLNTSEPSIYAEGSASLQMESVMDMSAPTNAADRHAKDMSTPLGKPSAKSHPRKEREREKAEAPPSQGIKRKAPSSAFSSDSSMRSDPPPPLGTADSSASLEFRNRVNTPGRQLNSASPPSPLPYDHQDLLVSPAKTEAVPDHQEERESSPLSSLSELENSEQGDDHKSGLAQVSAPTSKASSTASSRHGTGGAKKKTTRTGNKRGRGAKNVRAAVGSRRSSRLSSSTNLPRYEESDDDADDEKTRSKPKPRTAGRSRKQRRLSSTPA